MVDVIEKRRFERFYKQEVANCVTFILCILQKIANINNVDTLPVEMGAPGCKVINFILSEDFDVKIKFI